MATPTWDARELPLLEEVAAHEERGGYPDSDDLVSALGLPAPTVGRALEALRDAGYVTGVEVTSQGTPFEMLNISLLERGHRATGQWPMEDPYSALVALLEERIESATDPAEKSRLKKLLTSLTEVGKDVLTAVLTDFVKKSAGL